MQAKLDFIRQALRDDSGIAFEALIAFIIPKTPMAILFGDSWLWACGGYSTTLWVWWYISFPDDIIRRTLLHLSNNKSKTFISIICLKYVTIIINNCAAITTLLERQVTIDPHPVVFCVTDNIVPRIGHFIQARSQSLVVPWQDSSAGSWLAWMCRNKRKVDSHSCQQSCGQDFKNQEV